MGASSGSVGVRLPRRRRLHSPGICDPCLLCWGLRERTCPDLGRLGKKGQCPGSAKCLREVERKRTHCTFLRGHRCENLRERYTVARQQGHLEERNTRGNSSKLFPQSSESRHSIVVRNRSVERVWGTLLDAGTYITWRGMPVHEDEARKLPGFKRSRKRESTSTTKRISTSSRLDAFRYTDWR